MYDVNNKVIWVWYIYSIYCFFSQIFIVDLLIKYQKKDDQ